MDSKVAGEIAVRDLYSRLGGPGLAYTIIRPGGLSDKPSVGPENIHLSQGDVYSSEIPREDIANVVVAALLKGGASDFTTVEVNQIQGLTKSLGSLPDLPSELVHKGASSYSKLLDGLISDEAIKKKYPEIVSEFAGEGMQPIEKLVV